MVELESSSNTRFLHARAEAKSLSAITGLGGAGAGGAADEAHYLWPKYAAGMTYNSSFVDSLFGQAFYRPSRWVSWTKKESRTGKECPLRHASRGVSGGIVSNPVQ